MFAWDSAGCYRKDREMVPVLPGVARSSIRYVPQPRADESALTAAITRLASQYGRYG